jgi:hypothetical protein
MSFIKVILCLSIILVGYVVLQVQSPTHTFTQTTPLSPQPQPIKPLVYQGKTFDEWRGSPRIELDQRYLLETIRALGAFGRNGYGKEAAQAIYDAISKKNFIDLSPVLYSRDDQTAATQAIIQMSFIPQKDTMPLLLKLLNSNVINDRAFAYHAFFCMGDYYMGPNLSFTPEFLQMLFEKSLQTESPPINLTWTNLLGQCDHSGEYVLKYLREMIHRNDDKRFIDAFETMRAMAQIKMLDEWRWEELNGRSYWYPSITVVYKGMSKQLSEHGKAMQNFLKEEGLKSKNTKINKMSEYLLKELDECIKQK